jgi:hypothetical protein
VARQHSSHNIEFFIKAVLEVTHASLIKRYNDLYDKKLSIKELANLGSNYNNNLLLARKALKINPNIISELESNVKSRRRVGRRYVRHVSNEGYRSNSYIAGHKLFEPISSLKA